MNQPTWEEYMLPELKLLSDGKAHTRKELIDYAASYLKLSEDMKKETIGSGSLVFWNRGGWGLTYLKQSGLISSPKRAVFEITDLGRSQLKLKSDSLTTADLEKYPGYNEFRNRTNTKQEAKEKAKNEPVVSELSPEEMLEKAELQIKEKVCGELLDKIRNISPDAFERLVVNLLVAMGYGNKNDPNCGFAVGNSGDGGIDGVIKKDKLGIETLYVQAKRYKDTNKVSPHDIRDFAGALMSKHSGNSKSGVFITTSGFTDEGRQYVKELDKSVKVILINGKDLAEYMYQYGIGVSQSKVIVLNRIDNDYFDED